MTIENPHRTVGAGPATPARTATSTATGVRYLELHVLWNDSGPVASVRLANPGTLPIIELVSVFATSAGTTRPIGQGRIRVLPRAAVNGLIELDSDFPTTGAWLQQDPDGTPVQVWAGPAIDRPQIAANAA